MASQNPGLTSIVLPSAENHQRRVELIAKIVEEKRMPKEILWPFADKEGVWYMEILSGHQYLWFSSQRDRFAVFQILTFFLQSNLGLSDTERTSPQKILKKSPKKLMATREVDGKFHVLNP